LNPCCSKANLLAVSVFVICIFFLVSSCSKGDVEPKQASADLAPTFALNDIGGAKIDLASYRGKVVVLDFFATWCEPCRMLAPELKSFYDRHKGNGVVVIAVSIDEGPDAIKEVTSYRKEFGLTYPIVMDNGQVGRMFGVFSLPTTIIIDADGRIRNKHLGIPDNYAKVLEAEISPLLK